MTLDLSREKRIRDRIEAIYNKRREEFATLQEYNDYLEEKEEICFNLSEGVDVQETERRIRDYQRKHDQEITRRNAAFMREAQEAAGLGPSSAPIPQLAAAPPPTGPSLPPPVLSMFDDLDGPDAGGGGGAAAQVLGPASELTPEQRLDRARRAELAGGWSEELPRRRYVRAVMSSLCIY